MIQFEELKLELEGLHPDIIELANALGLEKIKMEIEQLEQRASQPGFWDDVENSQKILQKTGALKNKVSEYDGLVAAYEDTLALVELANEEEDLSLLEEAQNEVEKVKTSLESQKDYYEKKIKENHRDCRHFSPVNMTARMLFLHSTQVQAEQRLRIGRLCFIECIPTGQNVTASR